jgi:hypothetical protein
VLSITSGSPDSVGVWKSLYRSRRRGADRGSRVCNFAVQGNPVIASAGQFQDSFENPYSSRARFLNRAPDAGGRGGQFDMRYPEFTQPIHDGVGNHPQSRRDATFSTAPQA